MNSMTYKDIGDYLKKAATGNNTQNDTDGGYLETQAIVSEIIDNLKTKSILWDSATKYTITKGNGLKLPYNNTSIETTPTTGARAYWVEEADQSTLSKVQFGAKNIICGKLIVRVNVTDELIEDSAPLAQFIIDQGTKAIMHAVQYHMLRGSSTQAIKGIANAADQATLVSNCSADITEAEIIEFVDKLNPIYHDDAAWFIAPQQYTQLWSLNYTNETALCMQNGVPYLYGFPVYVLPQLTSDPYHVVLGAFSVYNLVYRSDISVADKVRFDSDETEFRIVLRIGGDVLAENQTLDDGNTYAAFVVADGGEANASSSSSSSSSESSQSSSSSSSSEGNSESSQSSSSEGYSSESSSSSSGV